MKYVRFRDPAGAVRRGELEDGTVHFANESYDFDGDEIDILPPTEPSKIVCIGRNYADHADEMGSDLPDRPMLFLKPPNTVSSHGDTVTVPAGKERIDHEAELGVVIGEQCRHVPVSDAEDVIAGFTCVNDLSNRDDQSEERNWVRGKAFDGAAPIGPVLATPDEVPDDAAVRSRVNGELKQDGTLDQLIFPIPELIAEITTYQTLEEGDVIATGTPEGVGPLADGDEVEIEVEGVGTLSHSVRIP
ncbi:fumarylacetoacetate hydrolase family protein [Halostagnicola kamekurae]|uniref:2-keto-4-pentenoate hydratase/2-oxohepta-3-ene-1,7-dioic acid hydratase (Catechol pathway) n=1 Tax=Halostagnicola kamekurae TaxID=619731 RepID=A0A1I6SQ57_9EURY|nr:fumarylacetoacetate hydrolase family protein [Halostagnicola kamekurae]SFS79046.1 2-keto-4-pentenoate hydratase/2-oxohepta-3-ene-1,7-dioic acid hydratase (catechol pathway) [Halostagnicola kamekurae]